MKGFDINTDANDNGTPIIKSKDGLYNFQPEPPNILSSALKNNPMSGIMFVPLIKLLFHKRKSIEWFRYKHRIAALFLMGIFNSFLSIIENLYIAYLRCFKETRDLIHRAEMDNQPPVFVLGHPRTGTTLLHSLLALDEERFSICDTFMVGFPHCFLWFERAGKYLFKDILSPTRPMDNMKLHFDLPQEDELGTNLLVGCTVSPYNSLIFMRDMKEYRKYQCFLEDQVSSQDVQKWTKAFRYFIGKVKLRDVLMGRRRNSNVKNCQNLPRRLVLKSPCHTGRVRLLLKLFPNAKFIFIHRNPYEVFLSGAHMASTTYGFMFLQQPRGEDLQEYILKQGEILHDEYFACRGNLLNATVSMYTDVLPIFYLNVTRDTFFTYMYPFTTCSDKQNSAEVAFDNLTKDPEGAMRKIYSQFGFDAFDAGSNSSYPKRLERECEELKGYKRNKFEKIILDGKLIETIKYRWKKQFQVLGYSDEYPTYTSN
jgi:hypothetical protein